jgi:hypothetical protein
MVLGTALIAASKPACGGVSIFAGGEGIALEDGSTVPRDSVIVSEWRDFAPVSVSGGGSASSDDAEAAATGLLSLAEGAGLDVSEGPLAPLGPGGFADG